MTIFFVYKPYRQLKSENIIDKSQKFGMLQLFLGEGHMKAKKLQEIKTHCMLEELTALKQYTKVNIRLLYGNYLSKHHS